MENRLFNRAKGLRSITYLMLIAIVLSLAGCKKSNTVPHGILTKDQMVKVLSEIYIAEEKVNKLSLQADSSQAVF
jgi:type III secretory pathway lipoprotein EscJ